MTGAKQPAATEGDILRALARQYVDRWAFFSGVKTGPTTASRGVDGTAAPLGILDGLAVSRSWAHPEYVGFEVKCYRGDFVRDTKWPLYLEHTSRLYFVCPSGVIQPSEVDERVGLMWYSPQTKRLVTKKAATFRAVPPPVNLLHYLAISRLDPDRHPFYSSRREQIEAWLADKENRSAVALAFRNTLIEHAAAAETRAIAAEGKAKHLEEDAAVLKEVTTALADAGVYRRYGETWAAAVKRALASSFPPGLLGNIRQIVTNAQMVEKALSEKAE